MGHIRIWVCACNQCMHTWLSTGDDLPNRCAKCKSTRWDRDKRTGEVAEVMPREPALTAGDIQTTIAVQSAAEPLPVERVKEQPARTKAKRPAQGKEQPETGKLKVCKHGFFIVNGKTQCRKCL